MRIKRSINEPIRDVPKYENRIEGHDKGTINAWEVGRKLAQKDPDLVAKILNGELPILGFKGGIKKKPKIKSKYGCLWYLAELQGLKGADLDIELDSEVELICSRTNIKVIFTPDMSKYSPQDEEDED